MKRATLILAALALLSCGVGQAKAGYVSLDSLDVSIGGVSHQYLGTLPAFSYSIPGPILIPGSSPTNVTYYNQNTLQQRLGPQDPSLQYANTVSAQAAGEVNVQAEQSYQIQLFISNIVEAFQYNRTISVPFTGYAGDTSATMVTSIHDFGGTLSVGYFAESSPGTDLFVGMRELGSSNWLFQVSSADALPTNSSGDFGLDATKVYQIIQYSNSPSVSFSTDSSHQYVQAAGYVGQSDVFFQFGNSSTSVVPEPSTLTLLGIGIAGIAGYGWRRRIHGVGKWDGRTGGGIQWRRTAK